MSEPTSVASLFRALAPVLERFGGRWYVFGAQAVILLPLDIVLAGPGLEDDFVRDAIRVPIEGTLVPFIAPVDLIVTKILAGRPKDLDDVRGVILAQGDDLDVPRVRRRLRRIENALDQSDLAPLFEAQLRRARRLD